MPDTQAQEAAEIADWMDEQYEMFQDFLDAEVVLIGPMAEPFRPHESLDDCARVYPVLVERDLWLKFWVHLYENMPEGYFFTSGWSMRTSPTRQTASMLEVARAHPLEAGTE